MFSLSLSILEDKMEKEYNKEEYNKLCAEFMGYKLVTPEMRKHPEEWISSYWENPEFNGSSKGVLCSENGLQYDTNWNWIMEVYSKIKHKDTVIRLPMNGIMDSVAPYINESSKIAKQLMKGEKEAVVKAIWEFLNWYKDNK